MTYSVSTILFNLITLALISVYTLAPLTFISIIESNKGQDYRVATVSKKLSYTLIAYCVNRVFTVFFGGVVFLSIELMLVIRSIFIVSSFFVSFNVFDKRLNFYLYGVRQLLKGRQKDD